MTDYLVDTHAFLWFLEESSKLPIAAARTIEENRTFVSSVTFFELAILCSLGRLGAATMADFFVDGVWDSFTLLPLDEHHYRTYEGMGFPSSHRDPFDRMLIAQAISERLISSAATKPSMRTASLASGSNLPGTACLQKVFMNAGS